MKQAILNRLKEQSTYRGLFVLASLLGLQVAPEQFDAIGQGVIAILALAAMFTPEKPVRP